MKKGFTLIELLAVIVILAIIALIAVPQILNIIENSRESSKKISADNYVKALENAITRENLTRNFNPTSCKLEDGVTTCDGEEIKVEFDGKLDSATVIFENNKVIYHGVSLENGEYVGMDVTPDECFISIEPGEIDGYICDSDIVTFNKDLKLGTVTGIKKIEYNDEKCKSYYDAETCSAVKSAIDAVGKTENLTFDDLAQVFVNMHVIDEATKNNVLQEENLRQIGDLFAMASATVDWNLDITPNKNLITKIRFKTFYDRKLKIIALNNTIEELEGQAFYNNQIKYLIMPEGLKKIGMQAFYCNDLNEVVIPNTVEEIFGFAFSGASDSKCYFNNQIKDLKFGNGLKIIHDGVFMDNQIEKLIIPEGVNKIGWGTFFDNKINELVIPSTLNTISSQAFDKNCLTSDMIINNSNLNLNINFSDQNNCN